MSDTNLTPTGRRLTTKVLGADDLTELLVAVGRDVAVVSFHRPAFSSGMHGSEPGVADAWHDLFVQSGVNVVFNGHDHDYERLEVDGVNYLVIRGAGAQLRSFTPGPLDETEYREDMVYHAVVVDVVGQQLTATAYRRDGSEMDGLVLGP